MSYPDSYVEIYDFLRDYFGISGLLVFQMLLYLLRKAYICAVNGLGSPNLYSSGVSNSHII